MSATKSNFHAWIVCLTASLFFFFTFIQLNVFNSISGYLLEELNVSAAKLGQLSSYYFIACVILLFPAGILLDRFSPKKITVVSMLFCVAGTFIFALAHSFMAAGVGRFMIGVGGTSSFLACMKIATRWFPTNKLALVTGMIVTMAMIGGMVAQTPFVILAHHIGWRTALHFDAAFGILITLLIIIIVHDYPPGKARITKGQQIQTNFWSNLGKVLLNRQNWLGGLYTSLVNLPIYLLGAIWGGLYLMQAGKLSYTESSLVTTMLFVGMIFGSPFFGWFSDKLGRRKLPMLIGAFSALIVSMPMIYFPDLHFWGLLIIFTLLGFIVGSQVISYPMIAESNPLELTGTSVSIASVLILAGGFTQPIFGWLLGLNWNHFLINGQPYYTLANYRLAMWIMPISFILSIVVTLLCKETHCKSIVKK